VQVAPWAREACAPAACAPYASQAAPRSLGLDRLVQVQVRARPWVAEAASWVQRGHHVFRVGATGRVDVPASTAGARTRRQSHA